MTSNTTSTSITSKPSAETPQDPIPQSPLHLLRLALFQKSVDCHDPIEYLNRSLHAFCELPGAKGGAIWAQLPNGSAAIIHEKNWYQATHSDHCVDGAEWQSALQSTILVQHPRIVANEPTTSDSLPSEYVLIPVRSDGEVRAILSVFIHGDICPEATEPDAWMDVQSLLELQFEEVIKLARTQTAQRDLSTSIPPIENAQNEVVSEIPSILDFAARISQELDPGLTATVLVNEIKSLTQLGRIGLFYTNGRTCKIAALSGVAYINRRSDAVRSLEALASQAALIGCEIWHPEEDESTTEALRRLLDQYYAKTDSRSICLIPIRAKLHASSDPNDIGAMLRDSTADDGPVVAVLCMEGLRESISKEIMKPIWETVKPVVASTVSRTARVRRIPGLSLWLALGDLCELLRGHRRRQVAIFGIAAGCLMAAMLFTSAPLELRVDGLIQPSEQCRLYCEIPGTVQEILVHDGANVAQGERLLTLTNPQLEADYQRTIGEREEVEQSLSSLRNHLNANRVTDESQSKSLRKEKAGLEARLASLHRQVQLLEEKRNKLVITSPIAGQSITWDVRGRLLNRPIEPGQHLLTIADSMKPSLLELRVPDRLSSRLHKAISGQKDDAYPTVEFALASAPHRKYVGAIEKVSDCQILDDQLGMVTLATVRLDPNVIDQVLHARPGTEVLAKIRVGNVSLGYSFLFEFHDWLQRVYFRYLG